nr:MAG TPA: hypothetical protein [Caudoviricetes sp.]
MSVHFSFTSISSNEGHLRKANILCLIPCGYFILRSLEHDSKLV